MTRAGLGGLTCALAGGALIAATSGCGANVEPAYPTAAYYDPSDYPPASYVATTEPAYYDGHPTYWYGGH